MDPNTKEQAKETDAETQTSPTEGEDAAAPQAELGLLGFFAKYEKVFVAVGVIAGVVGVLIAAITAAAMFLSSGPGGSGDPPPGRRWGAVHSRDVSVIAQAKPPGVDFWSGTLRILPRHGRIRFRVRVENIGSASLTGVVAEAELAKPLAIVAGKCWRRNGPCRGSLLGGGVPLPDLDPEESAVVVFSADVPSGIHGGTFGARLRINSDQLQVADRAEIVVSATKVEEAVSAFFEEVEGALAVGGAQPDVAAKSKRLLLGQWPTLTLQHPHRFGQIKQYEESIDGRPIVVDDLNYERWLQGQVVRVRGRVAQRPLNDDVDDEVVEQRVELRSPGGRTRLRCYIPRRQAQLFAVGDELEVKAVIVAWGSEGSANADLTVAACPAARVVGGG